MGPCVSKPILKEVPKSLVGPQHSSSTDWQGGARYFGEFKDGLRHGNGQFFWADGDRYEGQWVSDQRHGDGTLLQINGDIYRGGWEQDKQHGKGKTNYANGNEYVGQFAQGKREGQGKFTWGFGEENGDTYTGEFRDGLRHGHGTLICAGGTIQYKGEWAFDLKHGHISYSAANGDIFEGLYVQGKREGQGIFTWGDGPWKGHTYSGEWKNDKMEGRGEYFIAGHPGSGPPPPVPLIPPESQPERRGPTLLLRALGDRDRDDAPAAPLHTSPIPPRQPRIEGPRPGAAPGEVAQQPDFDWQDPAPALATNFSASSAFKSDRPDSDSAAATMTSLPELRLGEGTGRLGRMERPQESASERRPRPPAFSTFEAAERDSEGIQA